MSVCRVRTGSYTWCQNRTPLPSFGKAALSTSSRPAKRIPVEQRLFSYRMLACSAAFSRVSQPVVMPDTKALHASPSKTALPVDPRIDRDKGLGNLLDQHRIHVAVRRKTAVTIPRTGPYDPQAVRLHSPLCLQDLYGPLTYSTGIIFSPADPLYDIALVPIGTGLALIIEATDGQIVCRIEP